MQSEVLEVTTGTTLVTDLTGEVRRFARSAGGDGLLHVLVAHATAGVALMETGSGSEYDLADLLERLLPRARTYRHAHGHPGHGGDHVVPVVVCPSLSLPVLGGQVALGTWQSVVLVDPNEDNRRRQVRLSFLAG